MLAEANKPSTSASKNTTSSLKGTQKCLMPQCERSVPKYTYSLEIALNSFLLIKVDTPESGEKEGEGERERGRERGGGGGVEEMGGKGEWREGGERYA